MWSCVGVVLCGMAISVLLSWLQFEESMIVYDACRLIRERVPDAASGQRKCGWVGVASVLVGVTSV